ncbi:hypothetical protein COV22_00985, partial [Candidatus Woesearchaeota archaeon CG10_big_fil_rev_8_21_14_0_10_47_5]
MVMKKRGLTFDIIAVIAILLLFAAIALVLIIALNSAGRPSEQESVLEGSFMPRSGFLLLSYLRSETELEDGREVTFGQLIGVCFDSEGNKIDGNQPEVFGDGRECIDFLREKTMGLFREHPVEDCFEIFAGSSFDILRTCNAEEKRSFMIKAGCTAVVHDPSLGSQLDKCPEFKKLHSSTITQPMPGGGVEVMLIDYSSEFKWVPGEASE